MKKVLCSVLVVIMAVILCSCAKYSDDFQQIQNSYIQNWEMWDDSMIELYMYNYAEQFNEAYNATSLSEIPEWFVKVATYPLATMKKGEKAYTVGELTWDALYCMYQGDIDGFHKKMDEAKIAYEKGITGTMEEYLASTSEQNIINSYKVPH